MPLHSTDPTEGGWAHRVTSHLLRQVPARRIVWVLAGLLPLLLFAVVMLLLFTNAQELALERSLHEAAAGAAHAVDRAVGEQIGLLQGLAASRALDRDDLAAFRLDAERLQAQHQEWRTLILTDGVRPVLNLRLRPDEPVPPLRDPDSLRRVWTTQQPSVGNLANGHVAFRVPVVREGRMVYTLAAPTAPHLLREALRASPRPPTAAALLVGGDGVVIAATPDAPVPEGAPLPKTLRRTAPGRIFAVETQYAAWASVGSGEWQVLVFAPAAAVKHPFVRMRTAVVLGGLLAAGLTVVLVLALSTAWATGRDATRLRAEIGERVRAEVALRESQRRLHLAQEAAQAGTWEWDLRTHEHAWSEGLWRLYGLDPQSCAASYETWRQTIHPEDWVRTEQAVQAAVRQGTVLRAEWRVRLAEGGERWLMSRGHPVRDAEGRTMRYLGIVLDITERKRAEAELQFRNVLLSTQQEASIDGILVVDGHDRIRSYNRRFVEMWGLPEQLVEDRIDGQVLPLVAAQVADPQAFLQRVRFLYEHKEETSQDELLLKDGRVFDRYSAPMVGPEERYLGRVWYFRDITERQRVEESLRKSEGHARRLAHESAIMAEIGRIVSSTLDVDDVYERFVAEVKKLLPFDRIVISTIDLEQNTVRNVYIAGDGLPDRNVEDVYPLEGSGHAEMVRTQATLLIQTDDFTAYEDRFPRLVSTFRAGYRSILNVPLVSKGRIIGALLLRSRTPNAYTAAAAACAERIAGQIAGAIANAQLYADRSAAEAALAARTAQLETVRAITMEITRELDHTALLRLIVERAVRLVDAASGTCFLWDETVQRLVPQAWIGYGDWRTEFQPRLGEGLAGQVAQRRVGLATPNYPAEPYAVPQTVARKLLRAVMGEPLLYRDRLIGVLVIDHEVSERVFTPQDQVLLRLLAAQAAIAIENARLFGALQQAMEDIHHAQAELIRAGTLRALGQMAAGIAHDLNNTLAAILGQVELQKLRAPDATAQEGLALLETAAIDGAHTVQRLLNFARPRGTTPLGPVELAGIVEDAVEFTRPRWKDEPERHGLTIRVKLDLDGGLPPVQSHAAELREAIINVILNAVDAMPHGGTLTVTGRAAADAVTLAIRDTGIGMPPEVQARLFEPFFTTKGTRGTGLGLAGVYGIMERHGGRIAVVSAVGQGTTFTLTFRPATAAGGQGGGVPAPAAPATPRRILVVDDEAVVRTTLGALLRAIGHTATEAADGATALRLLEEAAPEIVFTDLGMPEMNGWELAKTIKARRPALPVVLLTGWQDQAPGADAERSTVDAVLGKPVPLEVLRKTIADLTATVPA